MDFFFGGRYLPLPGLEVPLKKTRMDDFEASANIDGSMSFNNFDSIATNGNFAVGFFMVDAPCNSSSNNQ